MVKIGYIVLALLIFMTGCGNFEKGNTADEESNSSNGGIQIDNANDTEDASSSGSAINEQCNFSEEALYIGEFRIIDMAGQSKDTLLLQLGEDYTHPYHLHFELLKGVPDNLSQKSIGDEPPWTWPLDERPKGYHVDSELYLPK